MNDSTIAYSGSIWPNGRFGVSRIKKSKLEPFSSEYPHPRQSLQECEERIQNYNNYLETGEPSPLGLSNVSKSHTDAKLKADRGSRGITSYGRYMVESGSFLLQQRYGKNRLSFLTLTVPNLSDSEMVAICENWSEILRVLMQRLSRFLERFDLPKEIIGVTEIQEIRSSEENRVCLHIHWVFVGRHVRGAWVIPPKLIRSWWKELLSKFILMPQEVDWRAVERIESVRKDASSYLGKYMSKGSDSVRKLSENGQKFNHPKAWWNCTNALKALIKSRKVRLNGDVAMAFVLSIEALDNPDTIWIRSVCIPHDVFGSIGVGYCGKIKISAIHSWQIAADYERECLSVDGHSLSVDELMNRELA